MNPNPNPTYAPPLLFHTRSSSSMAVRLLRPRLSLVPRTFSIAPQCPFLSSRAFKTSSFVSFAASHDDSKHSEVDKEKDGLKMGAQESQETWRETLASFKEQGLKMQNVSQEAYDLYFKKGVVVLNETSQRLKIQAEKAKQDLSVMAKEIGEESKGYISTATENSPEPVKEVVDTFTSSIDDLDDISTMRDFSLGIPYGLLLSLGGFLSFMITGSIPAIRFGVILGGTLLALSISSLKAQKSGESFALALKGQAAIAGILFFREIRLLSQRPSFLSCLTTLISAGMVAFYLYRMTHNDEGHRKDRLGPEYTELMLIVNVHWGFIRLQRTGTSKVKDC